LERKEKGIKRREKRGFCKDRGIQCGGGEGWGTPKKDECLGPFSDIGGIRESTTGEPGPVHWGEKKKKKGKGGNPWDIFQETSIRNALGQRTEKSKKRKKEGGKGTFIIKVRRGGLSF